MNTNIITLPNGLKTVVSYTDHYLTKALADYEIISYSEALSLPNLQNVAVVLFQNPEVAQLLRRVDLDTCQLFWPVFSEFEVDVECMTEECLTGLIQISTKQRFDFLLDLEEEQRIVSEQANRTYLANLDKLSSSGKVCPSCGGAMNSHKDFTHGCGNICYMCS